jgi:hypothetical protein
MALGAMVVLLRNKFSVMLKPRSGFSRLKHPDLQGETLRR